MDNNNNNNKRKQKNGNNDNDSESEQLIHQNSINSSNSHIQHRYTTINEIKESYRGGGSVSGGPISSPLLNTSEHLNYHMNEGDGGSQHFLSPMSSPNASFNRYYLKPREPKGKITFKKSILPTILMLVITAIVIFLIVYMRDYSANNQFTNQFPFVIEDDPQLLQVASAARQRLLNIHNGTMTELNFSILLFNPIGSWSLATYNGYQLSNVSRLVYLPFLVATVNWCISQNKDPHCLQIIAGPMIHDFSSIHAGIIFDTITAAPNAQFAAYNESTFLSWIKRREYVEQFLDSYGLLGNQTIMNKIYPSNSGPIPIWAEEQVIDLMGVNQMDPYDAAMLMLFISHGGIVPSGQSYITDLISEETFSEYTSLGFGLPPGTILHTVMGTTETQVNEVAHIVLPNGRELIISAFSNGYQNYGNPPYQSSILGMFASELITKMNLTVGNPPCIVMSATNGAVAIGNWQTAQNIQAFNQTYLYIAGGTPGIATVTWNFAINVSGLYEVCVWFPAGGNHTTKAIYVVNTADQSGLTYQFVINQVHYGARWVLLDSFYFAAGTSPTVAVSNIQIPSNQQVVADSIKITSWPTHDNIPGLSASFVIDTYDYGYD
ncbi:golvesin [Cavenderia fasciculata]|uniref:Golvesin n=1 Tax=Cavenderia fasciculata TaxID=261658 RepID=F4QFF5_CACFS|nr:golvesin [Cavenderia fasciculata]EGG14256.1 golvesin [Cavenderia fasciculata]|eukprot:XP_004350965.1 golvesin [Cavenderia fasciculata]